jgi:hypothetical protein
MDEATGDTNTEADAPESDPALTDFLDDREGLRDLQEEYHKPLVVAHGAAHAIHARPSASGRDSLSCLK